MTDFSKLLASCLLLFSLASSASAQPDTRIKYLSGHGSDDAVEWDFYCTEGARSGEWAKIDVPSCWELQGFGQYQYGFDFFMKACDDGVADEKGMYRYKFSVPSSWKGSHVEIIFEGSMTDTEVRINGQSAGEVHRGAFYRFSYDIGSLLRYGRKNLLEVTVSKESSDSTINLAQRRGDYWNFGGIFRPVFLECKPASYIDRVAIDARADGSFRAECYAVNAPANSVNKVIIKDMDGNVMAEGRTPASLSSVECQADSPLLWTAETPNLYVAEFLLCDPAGRILHRKTEKFGFRTMETRSCDGVYVNGGKIEVRGVDRHCFRPETGRTLSRRANLEDALLIKSLNMNAVRCSHYPPDPEFLDICDSLGIYVIDEFNGWQSAVSTEAGTSLVREMVTRDVNHPCILWWTNGNEGGFNYDLEPVFNQYDPQKRPVLYPFSNRNGYETKHYTSFGQMQEYMRKPEIFMPTEFLHGLYDGGHGAGLEDFWNEIRNNPRAAGGFLWSLADEGVIRHDISDSVDCHHDKAPDGIVGPHGEKEGSYDAIRQIWCPVQPSFDGKNITLENKFDFINLSRCTLRFRYLSFSGMKETLLSDITAGCPDAAPDCKASLEVPEAPEGADALRFTVYDNYGRELFTWSYDLMKARPSVTGDSFALSGDNSYLAVSCGGSVWTFDKKTGLLSEVSRKGSRVSLSGGPRFFAARRADRSADGNVSEGGKYFRHVSYNVLRDPSSFSGFEVDGDTLVAKYSYGAMKEVRWTFTSEGQAKVDYAYSYNGVVDLMGVVFDYPESCMKSKKWVGNGPFRVWQNRLKGPQAGVWEVAWNDSEPGVNFIYPEFKGFFSGVRDIVFDTTEDNLGFSVPEGKYLGIYAPVDGPNKNLFILPEMGISFMDVIPPVRTKFHSTDELGPQSRPVWASGVYRGSIVISL